MHYNDSYCLKEEIIVMQFTQSVAPVVVSGQSLRTANFQMKMNEKMFEIFSSSIYSNKIRAMIRELCTNAYDIHKTSGIPTVPFEVACPTKDSPMFVVRDFGTGLSEEQVFQIYTVYFESTKDGDNEAHGGYGLGSKSPLAYVDSFQIRSYQDGVLKCYTCYRKDGTPMISLILETTTTEPNGLEISVAVNESDLKRFKTEIGYVLSTFPTKPIITSGSVDFFEFKKTEKNLFVIKDFPSVVDESNKFFVYIEPVLYPLQNDMAMIFKNSHLYDIMFKNSNQQRFAFEFPIGSLDIPPSREQIENSKSNLEVFKKFMEDVDTIYKLKMEEVYEKTKDLPYRKAIIEVKQEIKRITDCDDSGLYKSFCRNPAFVYNHPFGENSVTFKSVYDNLGVFVGDNRTITKRNKICITEYRTIMRNHLPSSAKFLCTSIGSWNRKYEIDLRYGDSIIDQFEKYITGEKKLTIHILKQKNYLKFLEEHTEALSTDLGVKNVIYALEMTKDEVESKLLNWCGAEKIEDVFPSYEVIEWEALVKKYPIVKKQTATATTPKGTKKHPCMIITDGEFSAHEMSLNDLIDAANDTSEDAPFRYIKCDDGLSSGLYKLLGIIKRNWQLREVTRDIMNDYDGVVVIAGTRYDSTLGKLEKNGANLREISSDISKKIKQKLREFFLNSENWIFSDIGDIAFTDEWVKGLLQSTKIKNAILPKHDVVFDRRVNAIRQKLYDGCMTIEEQKNLPKWEKDLKSGLSSCELEPTYDVLLRIKRIEHAADTIHPISFWEFEELRLAVDVTDHMLLEGKMKAIGKKIPLIVEFINTRVYDHFETRVNVILDYMKEKGVF